MLRSRPNSSDAERLEDSLLDSVLADALRQYEAGNPIDTESIERAHPELLTKLRQRFSSFHAVQAARKQADQISKGKPATDLLDPWLDEDLEFLKHSLDKYEVFGKLQRGGQGVVYTGCQKGTSRLVAIKILLDGPLASERQRRRFEREIEVSARLRHPNIVRLYDTGTVRGRHYFAMEYVDGLPINDYVHLEDLTPRESVRLFVKICHAVTYAHQNGVIHRDLSPANILVDEEGEPHVFDFGLAKDSWDAGDDKTCTLTGHVIGTLPFISPEQAGGYDGEVDVRSDIYTLGIVLYLLLTDGFPYELNGDSQHDREVIINTDPTPLRKAAFLGEADRIRERNSINRDLEIVVAKAISKDKHHRYQSVADLAADLERWLSGDAISARADSQFYMLRKRLRKYRTMAAVAVVILLTIGVSWFQIRQQRDDARAATTAAFRLFEEAYDLEEAFRSLPGGIAVRDQFIKRLADDIPSLQHLLESDDSFLPIQARLLEKQGDLAFEQGNREEALRLYEDFLQASLELVEHQPAANELADAVTRAYRKCAETSDDAVQYYQRGIQWGGECLKHAPERSDTLLALCRTHLSFGEHLEWQKEHARSLEQHDLALGLCASIELPKSRAWQSFFARLKDRRGCALLNVGRGEEGLKDLQTSLELREQIAEDNPSDVQARHELMLAYKRLATSHANADRKSEAITLYQEAVKVGELLLEMDPSSVELNVSLFNTYYVLTLLYLKSSETENAEMLSESAMALARKNAVFQDRRTDGRTTLAFAHCLRGQILLEKELTVQARAAFEEAALIRAAQLAEAPTSPAARKSYAVAQSWLAKVSRALKDYDRAAEHYRRAYEIYVVLHGEQPDILARSLDLIRSQINLSTTQLDLETEVGDDLADVTISQAACLLKQLQSSDKLVGYDRDRDLIQSAIQKNRDIIHDRREHYSQ